VLPRLRSVFGWAMSDKPPFDTQRAVFLLIACVFAVASVAILATLVMCLNNADAIVAGNFKCDADNRVFDLMATLISSALALYAGRK
jgi:hypothetical protein